MKFINQNGEKFIVLKEVSKEKVDDYTKIQNKLRCDLVIRDKKNTILYFINHIPNIEPIEETNE